MARIAAELGQPFMPWQHLVANVGGEIVESFVDGQAVMVPAYREVWLSVPRQNGKTTLVLCWALDRALYWGGLQNIIFSSQTANDGRRTILEEWVPRLERSPFWPLIGARRVRRAAGSEGVRFSNGSRVDVLANSKSSGHGRTLHFGVIDEAWDDVDNRRVGAIGPAQITVPDAQILGCSTMGTDESTFLNNLVDMGRASVDFDDASIAYFEWSAGLDEDIMSPAVWAACNPAWDITITGKVMSHQYATMPEGEFRRAHLNQRTSSSERVIAAHFWERICSSSVTPEEPFVFGLDTTPDQSRTSIAVADKSGRAELLHNDPGFGWAVPAAELAKKYRSTVALDPAGPAGSAQEDLERAGVTVTPVTGRDMAKACGDLYHQVIDGTCQIRTHEALSTAVASATKKVAGDTWTWARKGTADISPLVAVTEALWVAQQVKGAPHFYTF